MKKNGFYLWSLVATTALMILPAAAQQTPAKGPAVGVVTAMRKSVTRSSEYVGRIQAIERVNLIARVAAYLDERLFTEGAEVKRGELLYRLEKRPFAADVRAKQATISQLKAQHENAQIVLGRAKALLSGPAGQQAAVDTATANAKALEAQVLGAEAQLEQSEVNLDYTDIRAPIDGKVGRTSVTTGNYVSPGSGTLATIVSQDPMYVVFNISSQNAIALHDRSIGKQVAIKIRLGNGRIYGKTGTLDFFDNTIAGNTDTITLRGPVANPLNGANSEGTTRELVDGEFVTVLLDEADPIEAVMIPRTAVLTDQSGDYIYVVDRESKARQRRVQLGPSTPSTVAVVSGLADGERVVVEGIQRIRPGAPVSPETVNNAETTLRSDTSG